MTMDQLRYFYEVAKCLSFSTAARNLYISQPNLTKYIANLEKELGLKLFDRSTHHCALTEEGEAFLRSTEYLFYQLNSRVENTKLRARNPFSVVTIGLARSELPPRAFLRHLNGKNKGSTRRYLLQEESYLRLIERLREHQLDLIVTTDRNVRAMKELDYLTLRPFEMLLAVHNANPLCASQRLLPGDCGDEMVFICVPEGKLTPFDRMEEIYWKTGVRMNLSVVDSPADVLSNAQVGAGVGIVPDTMDLTGYRDLSFYRFEPWQGTEQVLAWRREEKRPEVLELIEEVRAMAPFVQPSEVPILGEPGKP